MISPYVRILVGLGKVNVALIHENARQNNLGEPVQY